MKIFEIVMKFFVRKKIIRIPEGTEIIGDNTFEDFYNLKEVCLASTLKIIGRSAFRNCNFEEITIPEGCERIESYAFAGCEKLKRVVIPSTCTFIGTDAFAYCPNIEYVILFNPQLTLFTLKWEGIDVGLPNGCKVLRWRNEVIHK